MHPERHYLAKTSIPMPLFLAIYFGVNGIPKKPSQPQPMTDQLCLSLRTIEVHRSNILDKLALTTLAELMLKYCDIIRNGT